MSNDSIEPPDFESMLSDGLDLIDRELAESGIALTNRPLSAARHFVRSFVLQVSDGKSEEPRKPGEFNEYFDSEWFKVIYARTVAWYAGRYGRAMDQEPERTFAGCILILGTPFLVRVPVVTRRPGKPGETIWVCFPDRVEHGEDALTWIENGPNMAALPRGDGMKARRLANEVATCLRAITVGLATVTAGDERVTQLRDQILTHLDGAAAKIVRGRPEDLKHAQWDMQMACELALKMLAQQRRGSFAESHDLYTCTTTFLQGGRLSSGAGYRRFQNGSGWPSGAMAAVSRSQSRPPSRAIVRC